MASSDFTINITGKVTSLKELGKVTSEMNEIEKQINKNSKAFGGFSKNIKKNISVSQQGLAGLGNKLGFVAFQWTFIASRANLAFQQITAGIRDVIREGSELEDNLIRVRIQANTLTGGFGDAAKNANFLTDEVLTLGLTSGVEINKLTNGAEALTKVFGDFDDVKNVLPGFSKILLLEKDLNPESFATGLKAANIAFGDMNEIMAIASVVADNTGLSVETFLDSIGRAGLRAKGFGTTSKDLAVILGVVGDTLNKVEGQQPGIFTNQLFNAIIDGLDGSTERGQMMGVAFKKLGVDLVGSGGKMNNIIDIMDQLQVGLGKLNKARFLEATGFLFGEERGELAGLALLNADLEDLRKESERLNGAIDITNRKWEVLSESSASNIQKIENGMTIMKTLIVNGLSPAISELAKVMEELFRDSEFKQGLQDIGRYAAEEFLPVIKAIIGLLVNLFKVLTKNKPLLRLLIKAIGFLTFALGGLAIIGTVTALMAVLGSVIQKLGSEAVIGAANKALGHFGITIASLGQVLKVVALSALVFVLSLFAFNALLAAFDNGKATFDQINKQILGMAVVLALAATAMAGVQFGLPGIAIAGGFFAGAFAAAAAGAADATAQAEGYSDAVNKLQGEIGSGLVNLLQPPGSEEVTPEEYGSFMRDWWVHNVEIPFSQGVAWLEDEFGKLLNFLNNPFPDAGAESDGGMEETGKTWGESLGEGFQSAMDFFGWIYNELITVFEDIGTVIFAAGKSFGDIFGTAFSGVIDFWKWIAGLLNKSFEDIGSFFDSVGGSLSTIFGDAFQSLLDFLKWIKNSLFGEEKSFEEIGNAVGEAIKNGILTALGPVGFLIGLATGGEQLPDITIPNPFESLFPPAYGEQEGMQPSPFGGALTGGDLGFSLQDTIGPQAEQIASSATNLIDQFDSTGIQFEEIVATGKIFDTGIQNLSKQTQNIDKLYKDHGIKTSNATDAVNTLTGDVIINDKATQLNTLSTDLNSSRLDRSSVTHQTSFPVMDDHIKSTSIAQNQLETLSITLAENNKDAVEMGAAVQAFQKTLDSVWIDSEGSVHFTKFSSAEFNDPQRQEAKKNLSNITEVFKDIGDRIDINNLEKEYQKALEIFDSSTIQKPFFETGGKDPNPVPIDPLVQAMDALIHTIISLNLSFEDAKLLADTRGLGDVFTRQMFDQIGTHLDNFFTTSAGVTNLNALGDLLSGGMNVPALASGGIVDEPTYALIGESGPEAVIPLGSSFGNNTFNVDVNVTIDTVSSDVDIDNLVDRVAQGVVRKLESVNI